MAHLDIPVTMRWSDLDGYGHVNNVSMLRLLEEARIQAFWAPPPEQVALGARSWPTALPVFATASAVHTVVASHRIEYRHQLGYRRDGVIVRLWVSRLGGASLTLDYQVLTADDTDAREPVALARTVIVLVDAQTQRPARLDSEHRRALADYCESPLVLRD